LKDKLIHALAAIAGFARAFAGAATGWASNPLATSELFIARVHGGLPAALAVVQGRFGDIPAGDADFFAVLHVGNGAAADRVFYGFFDVLAVAPQKPLAIYRALVLAV
jgi:hypothetical protein